MERGCALPAKLVKGWGNIKEIWFVVPGNVWSMYYTLHAVMAFDPNDESRWVLQFIEVLLEGLGSLSLLSIFILILVYWTDILRSTSTPTHDVRGR